MRLAFPRRVYTQSHMDYVAEVILGARRRKARTVRGFRIDGRELLRHFTAELEWA